MAVRIEARAEPIPGYRLIERLGGGGFGEVWKAEAPGGLHKAIKFVFGDLRSQTEPDDAEGQMVRAEQELKALSRVKTVRHPYILSLERYDIVDGQLMIVMELADKSLWDRFRECRSQGLSGIPRDELLGYMEETAEALDLMNGEHQLQHLDIKPQNLFLIHNHIKVADFGLVKDLEGMVASVTGGVTPVYAAPETFDGWVSRFCDQYSLGIVYQELLTGHRPFNGTNVRQLVLQHLQGVPNLTPLGLADRTPVARALAKNPDERFPNCTEFVKALASAGAVPKTATLQELNLDGRASANQPAAQNCTPVILGEESASSTTCVQARPSTPATPLPPADPMRLTPPRVPTAARSEPSLEQIAPEVVTPEPLEIHGDGVLVPALVIGLGGLGLQLLQRFRALLLTHFGTLDAVPHLRLLHLDTDPEVRQLIAASPPEEGLSVHELLHTRLYRPSHYVKVPETRARLDSWMDVQMLYRIPRTPATAGVRTLGRLAFVDNYRLITLRIQAELERCLAPEALPVACQQTGLTVRSNRPRVYILTSLGGGTGSGMFLDLAYLVRVRLLKLGYVNPDVVGILCLPPADRQAGRGLPLANAYAALTELNHFSMPLVRFSACYLEKEPPLVDVGPPFSRCILLPTPDPRETKHVQELFGLTADFLTRDLLTPLGRLADQCRARLPGPATPAQRMTCQSFGVYRLSWPRQVLLRRVSRRMCRHLVQRWSTKDCASIQDAVQERVSGEWANRGWTPEGVIEELQRACEKALDAVPETTFVAVTSTLPIPTGKAPEIDPEVYVEAFTKLEKIVGRLDADTLTRPPALVEALTQGSAALVSRWCKQLEAIAADLIEEPQFRLAGAEAALRQFMATIQKTLEHYEPLSTELSARVAEARARIDAQLTSLQGGRRTIGQVAGLVELLKQYPKWRYQSLVLHQLTATYVSLRGRLSDQVREINFCRARLHELEQSFTDTQPTEQRRDLRPGREFFPGNSRDLLEATELFINEFQAEDWQAFDALTQEMMQREFGGLVQICLAPANCLPRLEAAMLACAESFVSADLAGHDVAEMFLSRHREEQTAQEEIITAFDEAAPEFATARLSRQPEICILATPATPAGEQFRAMVQQALPDVAPVAAIGGDDIVFYREVPQLLVANLDQLGPQGQEAYQQMLAVAQCSPHARRDVGPWQPIGAS